MKRAGARTQKTRGRSGSPRLQRGMRGLKRVLGAAGLQVVKDLREVSPDMARFLAEFPFADIYARKVLSLKTRELCAIASLAALGHPRPQLHMHVHGALNVGCTPAEITEVILQTSVFAGFPAALNGMTAVRDVFAERLSRKQNPPDANRRRGRSSIRGSGAKT